MRPQHLQVSRSVARVLRLLLLWCVALFAVMPPAWGQEEEKRVVIGLYDTSTGTRWASHLMHTMLQMPLEHLGLVLEPYDVQRALPDLSGRTDVRGVVTWFQKPVADPQAYVEWVHRALDARLRYVIFGNLGFIDDDPDETLSADIVDPLMARMGLRRVQGSYDPGYLAHVVAKAPGMMEYERAYPERLTIQGAVESVDPHATVFLRVERDGTDHGGDVVLAGPLASFVADGYSHYSTEGTPFRQWFLDPFAFLEEAFDTASLPKPDTTTAVGRRIYYSHVDGDGWRNWPNISPYRSERRYAIDVIIDRVVAPYPDLPVTIAPIAADLDPDWCGDAASADAARRIFALPQVEAASHTYSHPFFWALFEHGSPTSEITGNAACHDAKGIIVAPLARAYDNEPFDLEQEIRGAADYIEGFLPPGKSVELLQWSGDTSPTASMLRAVGESSMLNINGGDTRFDGLFPSVSWVAPIGRSMDGQLQIYASASNENTYTNLWTGQFYGFRILRETLERTESPRRLKPINVYYHVYSGERMASLSALLQNLDYARSQEIVPVWTSTYVRIAQGFYSTRLAPVGPQSWRVEERGELQTLRFDHADASAVDMGRSTGVLGWRHHQGSLYVALDPAYDEPVVTLGPVGLAGGPRPSLVQSRWQIEDLEGSAGSFGFAAGGFGAGQMEWRVAPGSLYEIFEDGRPMQTARAGEDGILRFELDAGGPELRAYRLVLAGPSGS